MFRLLCAALVYLVKSDDYRVQQLAFSACCVLRCTLRLLAGLESVRGRVCVRLLLQGRVQRHFVFPRSCVLSRSCVLRSTVIGGCAPLRRCRSDYFDDGRVDS